MNRKEKTLAALGGLFLMSIYLMKKNFTPFTIHQTNTVATSGGAARDIRANKTYVFTGSLGGTLVKVNKETFMEEATTVLGTGQSYALAISDKYVYYSSWVTIYKVDIETLEVVASLECPPISPGLWGVVRCLLIHGEYMYVGMWGTPGYIVKIDLSSFTVINSLLLEVENIWAPPGDDIITHSSMAASGDYLYVGLWLAGGVLKIDLSTFTAVDLIKLPTHVYTVIVYEDSLYVGGGDINAPFSAVLHKIDLAAFNEKAKLELEAGSYICDLAVAGNSLYAATAGGGSDQCYKIDLESFTVDSENTTLFPIGALCLIQYGNYLYVAPGADIYEYQILSDVKQLKMNISEGTYLKRRS